MNTIVIRYFEKKHYGAYGLATMVPLGTERYESISEVLLPSDADHKVFYVKKFTGLVNYRWFVEGISRVSAPGTMPADFAVILSKAFVAGQEEYLRQTLRKTGYRINSVVQFGTLVEVDYGFVQNVGREDGMLKTNKRYCDTLQSGEMHKRRLAIVVRVTRATCQVVPITSVVPAKHDKTCFQLAHATLKKMATWGSSGKDSWALCSMIESVSLTRILPPVTFYEQRGRRRHGRNLHYTLRLTEQEKALLKKSLLHAIGAGDYHQLKTQLAEAPHTANALQQAQHSLSIANYRISKLERERADLLLIKEVAIDWDKQIGEGRLKAAVDALRELYTEIAIKPSDDRSS